MKRVCILALLLLFMAAFLCGCVESVENPTEKPAGSSGSTAGSSAPSVSAPSDENRTEVSVPMTPEVTELSFQSYHYAALAGFGAELTVFRSVEDIQTFLSDRPWWEDSLDNYAYRQLLTYDADFFVANTLVVLSHSGCETAYTQHIVGVERVGQDQYTFSMECIASEITVGMEGVGVVFVELADSLPEDAAITVQTEHRIPWLENMQDLDYTSRVLHFDPAGFDSTMDAADVFLTRQDLDQVLGFYGPSHPLYSETAKYDDAFFAENTLIVIYIKTPDVQTEYRVVGVRYAKDSLVNFMVDLERISIDSGDGQLGCLLLVEVPVVMENWANAQFQVLDQ